ncbi:MAG: hypothetical protein GY719_28125 [bacterium]|nr:hypothetical protein [bacterium]
MRSKGLPIAIGCFLGVILITAYEAASSHAGYTWTTETDSAWGEIQKIRIRDGRWRLAVDFRGEIEMTPVEDGIANLGPGAFLEIEERREGVRRRLEATPGPGGRPKLAWFVDGEATPPGEESREWLARVLPRVYRVTGIDAEGRVGRLLAAGGIAGVLAEIDKIGSDRVQRIYFEKLLQKAEPAAADLERVLRGMERAIGSDHEMGRLMRMIPAERLTLESTADAFVAATRTIGSDFELRRALTPLLQAPVFPEISESMLDATTGIGSDFELARLLIGVIEAYPLDRPLPAGFTRALRTVASDHEQRKVLKAALRRSGPGGVELDALLETAALGIGSDFELAAVMVGFTESHHRETCRSRSSMVCERSVRIPSSAGS